MTATQNSPAATPKTSKANKTQKVIKKDSKDDKNNCLVVTARIKAILHDANMNTSGTLSEALSSQLLAVLHSAIENAKNANRKTVRNDDVMFVNILGDASKRGLACDEEVANSLQAELGKLAGRACDRAEGNKRKKLIVADV